MIGEFFYRHHEELRLKLYDTENDTFPIPLKYVDRVRQTQTSIYNEHIINGLWPEAKGGVDTGSTRFQILRTRLPEGYKWVVGRPTKIQKTTRADRIWPEAWTQLSKKQQETKIAEWTE